MDLSRLRALLSTAFARREAFLDGFLEEAVPKARHFIEINQLPKKSDPEIARSLGQALVQNALNLNYSEMARDPSLKINDFTVEEKTSVLETGKRELPDFMLDTDGYISIQQLKRVIKAMYTDSKFRNVFKQILTFYFDKKSSFLVPNSHIGQQEYDATEGYMANYAAQNRLTFSFLSKLNDNELIELFSDIDSLSDQDFQERLKLTSIEDILGAVEKSPSPHDQVNPSDANTADLQPLLDIDGLGHHILNSQRNSNGQYMADIVKLVLDQTLKHAKFSINDAAKLIRRIDIITNRYQSFFQHRYDEWYEAYKVHHGLND